MRKTAALRERAARIGAQLDGLYPAPPIPLDHRDPFTLLCAVVLSAQCTDARVNTVTPALFALGPTPAALAARTVAQIDAIVRPCGLAPMKARNLRALSALLVERHRGVVPADLDALEALPGVGHKTASVVMSQAFGVPAFAVDTHIHRLAGRWRLSHAGSVVEVERDLTALYPAARWNRLHLQMIYFGREHCPALRHDPAACPICLWAAAPAGRRRRAAGG